MEHAFDSVVVAHDMAIGVKATEAATVFCEEGQAARQGTI